MDSTLPDESAAKQPERIATSKVERYLDESREYLQATAASSDIAAGNSDTAAHYAQKVADSNFYVICLLALFGGGLAIAVLLSVLILILLAVTHVIML